MLKFTTSVITAFALFGGALSARELHAEQALPASMQEQLMLDVTGFGQAVPGENLALQSGRQATQIDKLDILYSANTNHGYQDGNTITGSPITGYNSVSNGAFTNMNGFATVIQNSGNQVLIQNDLIVNITMH
jgi:hypothetical protein